MNITALDDAAEKAIKRLDVFADSEEVADGVNQIDDYWAQEAAVHIWGLWKLANQLAMHLQMRLVKESTDEKSN